MCFTKRDRNKNAQTRLFDVGLHRAHGQTQAQKQYLAHASRTIEYRRRKRRGGKKNLSTSISQ